MKTQGSVELTNIRSENYVSLMMPQAVAHTQAVHNFFQKKSFTFLEDSVTQKYCLTCP